jgi:hypothetical protein
VSETINTQPFVLLSYVVQTSLHFNGICCQVLVYFLPFFFMLILTCIKRATRSWGYLPTDILHQILELLQDNNTSGPYNNKKDLVQCQLVCQAWSIPVQYILYRDICLGTNALQFKNTVSKPLSMPRLLVNSIYFGSQFADSQESIQASIDLFSVIIEHCPNIQHISIHQRCQPTLLHCLLAESTYLAKLCSIQKAGLYDRLDFVVFGAVCFKQTLKSLDIVKRPSWNIIEKSQFNYLFNRLKSFPNLTILNICLPSFLPFENFHSVIDSCPSLQSLQFSTPSHDYMFDNVTLSSLQSNNNIRYLDIIDVPFDENTISYISKKFKRLQGLKVQVNPSFPWPTLPNSFWKKSVIAYLKTLQNYTIRLNTDVYEHAKTYINHIGSSRVHQSSMFAINVQVYDCRNGHSFPAAHSTDATISHKDNLETIKLHLCRDNILKFLEDSLSPVLLGLCLYELRIRLNDIYSSSDSWTIFDYVLSQCDKKHGLNLIIDGLIFNGNPPPRARRTTKPVNIFNLTIKRSLFHVRFLPEISKRIDKVSILKLDLCNFTGDANQQKLKIHLPSTSVQTLKINFPTSHTSSHPSHHPEFLTGPSKDTKFILKIDTEAESYYGCLFRSQQLPLKESLNFLTDSAVMGVKTFVLWIKCRKLEQLVISDKEGLVLDMFEEQFPKT